MPLNVPGILVPFHLLIKPRLVLPGLTVKDIRHLDFEALKKAGYKGAIFDKDNCLTVPDKDTLVPELQEAWDKCRTTFGEGNVIVVSNSAGTQLDAGGIQAESVSYHLRVPVLPHPSYKPSYSCISGIRRYFSSLNSPIPDDQLIVVGDRIFTDVVMANRMHRRVKPFLKWGARPPPSLPPPPSEPASVPTTKSSNGGAVSPSSTSTSLSPSSFSNTPSSPPTPQPSAPSSTPTSGPLAIWTTAVWKKEAMLLRWCERRLVDSVRKWTDVQEDAEVARRFTQVVPDPPPKPKGLVARAWEGIKKIRAARTEKEKKKR